MAFVWKMAEGLGINPIEKMSQYFSLEDRVSLLESNMEDLSSQQDDVEKELSTIEKHGKKRKTEVEVWMKNVDKMKDEVYDIINGVAESRLISRISLGNRVDKALKQVHSLQTKRENFVNQLVVYSRPNVNTPMPTREIVGETAHNTLQEIRECLRDPEVGTIGIYGMGGVGKTFIMMHICNEFIGREDFEDVIWVTMSKAVNLQMVQGEIAKAIGLDLSNDEDEENRSRRIFVALKSSRFVLILDEVWEAFPLDRIGIPQPKRANGCKLLFSTRDLGVCRILESQKQIKVDLLSHDEAFHLFMNIIGGDTVLSPHAQAIARHVASECGRLPLAIVTVGRDLRHQSDVRVWRNTLDELKYMKKIKHVEEHILLRLRYSYDRLRNEVYRGHFLYCALYPRNHHIPNVEIIKHWVWDGLIEEMDKTKELDKGHTILKELEDACMLELESGPSECVKMHNLIRYMAISITRTTPHFMVKAGVGLQESPSEEEWAEDVLRISLMANSIEMLPHAHKCLKLSTLLLQNNYSLRSISPSFFMHLRRLRVLNLSHTMIDSLPESISALVNLHALLLGSCSRLNILPSLGNLKALRVLDISSTAIDKLPQGLEELVKLRHLDLSRTSNLGVIQTGLISSLCKLEDLQMYGSGWRWSSNKVETRGGASIEEVTNLKRLCNLSLHFANLVSLTDYVNSQKWRQLKAFTLFVGPTSKLCRWHLGYSVGIASCDLIDRKNSHVIPENTECLRIEECRLTRISQLCCSSNLKELKECEIYKCHGMNCIVKIEEDALPSIEKLDLWELPCSRVFSNIGVVPHGALGNLRFLYIKACHRLNILFSLGLLQQLTKLEEVKVQDCRHMKEIVAKEEWVEANITSCCTRRVTITSPSLKLLTLVDLPGLESIGGDSVSCISLTYLEIKNCPELKKLPFNDLSFNLKGEIKGSRVWWDALVWDGFNDGSRTLLQSLFKEDRA